MQFSKKNGVPPLLGIPQIFFQGHSKLGIKNSCKKGESEKNNKGGPLHTSTCQIGKNDENIKK